MMYRYCDTRPAVNQEKHPPPPPQPSYKRNILGHSPQELEMGMSAFPSLTDFTMSHASPVGIGLNVLENQYYDHFSCTTAAVLVVGCILCVIAGLIIAIILVAILG
jgi:hypothetical protein